MKINETVKNKLKNWRATTIFKSIKFGLQRENEKKSKANEVRTWNLKEEKQRNWALWILAQRIASKETKSTKKLSDDPFLFFLFCFFCF
jgi:hypothetical protein